MGFWGKTYIEKQVFRLDNNRTCTVISTYINHHSTPTAFLTDSEQDQAKYPIDYKGLLDRDIEGDLTKEEEQSIRNKIVK